MWRDSMPYVIWQGMTAEEQQAYLDANNIEFRGYELMGHDSQPTRIEFQSKQPKQE